MLEAGSTLEAVQRDLSDLAKRDPKLAESSLAAAALAMAAEIDSSRNSATSKSMCTRVLLDAMECLRDLAQPEQKKGPVDDLNARRDARLRRAAAS